MELHSDEAMSSLYTLHNLIRCHAGAFAQDGVMACASVVAKGAWDPVQVWGCCDMTR